MISQALDALEFTWKEINDARENNRLLTFGIELSNKCNLHCIYCYRNANKPLPNELTLSELTDASRQAIELGARKAGIVGAGEPTIDRNLLPLISFLVSRGIRVSLFTNGTLINHALAQQLVNLHTKVILKVNSLDEDVHDMLVGKKGGYKLMMRGLRNLLEAGYPPSSLTIECAMNKKNLRDLVRLWRWCRSQGYTPFFERLTPQGRAANSDISLSTSQLRVLFNTLSALDEKDYGLSWPVQPPWVSHRCLRHYYNCLIDATGDVMPCSGVNIVIGNVRHNSLAEIISSSRVIRDLRYIEKNIKGRCSNCERKPYCYGCRGAAYHLNNDYLAEDPLCWHYEISADRGIAEEHTNATPSDRTAR